MTGESSGKLLAHLSSKTTAGPPATPISVPGCGGINDAAFSTDGARLVVACRDGSVRLLDWPSGTCVGGFQVRSQWCCARRSDIKRQRADGARGFHALLWHPVVDAWATS